MTFLWVYTRNNFPERELLPDGVARVLQSPRREVIPCEHPTGMSYLLYYTGKNAKHKRGKNYKQILEKYSSSALLS